MRTKNRFFAGCLSLILSLNTLSAQTDEIANIDKRLEELKRIWHQDNAIINGFTKNRTVSVVEGSKEHKACLVAASRMTAAEAEAKTLKEKRKELETGKNDDDAFSEEVADGQPNSLKNKTADESNKSGLSEYQLRDKKKLEADIAKRKATSDANLAELEKKVGDDVIYKNASHGPKIKNVFIGMTFKQFKNIAEQLANEATGSPTMMNVIKNDDHYKIIFYDPKKNFYESEEGTLFRTAQPIEAKINNNGCLVNFEISEVAAKKLFKSENLTFEEFVERFEEAYDLDLDRYFEGKVDNEQAEIINWFRTVTSEGVLVELKEFSLKMEKSLSEKEAKSAFD